mmetsp:Transcript_30967/g.88778  ORF Transcript_30967/g.88778 Transcript_30967/m.88778 type:complete len:87 (-) Transcript_30967:525-785(-)
MLRRLCWLRQRHLLRVLAYGPEVQQLLPWERTLWKHVQPLLSWLQLHSMSHCRLVCHWASTDRHPRRVRCTALMGCQDGVPLPLLP